MNLPKKINFPLLALALLAAWPLSAQTNRPNNLLVPTTAYYGNSPSFSPSRTQNEQILPEAFYRSQLKYFNNFAPAGRPAVVQFGGHSISFLPTSFVDSEFLGGLVTSTPYVKVLESAPYAAFPYSPLGSFPNQKQNALPSGQQLTATYINPLDTDGPDLFNYPTLVAATTYNNKIWVIVGGVVDWNSDVSHDYFNQTAPPAGSFFKIYTYEVNPLDPQNYLSGTFQFVQNISFPGLQVGSIAVAVTGDLSAVPPGGSPQSLLSFFVSTNNTQPNQMIVAYTTSDLSGKLAVDGGNTPKGAIPMPANATQVRSDLSAVAVTDSKGKPIVALAWSSDSALDNSPVNSCKQYAMGMNFFDPAKPRWVGYAPAFLGKGGGGTTPIPQSIRMVEGRMLNEPGSSNPPTYGTVLQIFGNFSGTVARLEYVIQGPDGQGSWWSPSGPVTPDSNTGAYRPAFYVIPSSVFPTSPKYPDLFTAVNIPVPYAWPVRFGSSANLPFFKNAITLMCWSEPISSFNDPKFRGYINSVSFESDHLQPFGEGIGPDGNPQLQMGSLGSGVPAPDPSSWVLLGVIQGLPPTAMPLVPKLPVFQDIPLVGGTLTIGESSSKGNTFVTSTATSYGVSYAKGFSVGPTSFGIEAGFSDALTSSLSGTDTYTVTYSHFQDAGGESIEAGYMLFHIPSYQGCLYRRCDPYNNPISLSSLAPVPPSTIPPKPVYEQVFVGRCTGFSLSVKRYQIADPDRELEWPGFDPSEIFLPTNLYSTGMQSDAPLLNDLTGWSLHEVTENSNSHYSKPAGFVGQSIESLNVTVGGGVDSSGIAWTHAQTNQSSNTRTVNIAATLSGLLGSVSGDFSYTTSTAVAISYATETNVSLGLSYPDPAANSRYGPITSYNVQPHFYRANAGQVGLCDFVPTAFKDQNFQPFLLTYNVTGLPTAPNGGGNVAASSSGPLLTLAPKSKTANLGGLATFEVATKSTGVSFQWYKNGVALPHQRAALLALPAVTSADEAEYYVVVSNKAGKTTSDTVALTVLAKPLVLPMLHQAVSPGQNALLKVEAYGKRPLTYQWSVNGREVAGATSETYLLPAEQIKTAGAKIRVVVTNALGFAVGLTEVVSDPTAPIDPGKALYAGLGYSPAKFRNQVISGQTYDLVAMQGASVTAQTTGNHHTRVAWVDTRGSLTYAEMTGPGWLTVTVPHGTVYTKNGVSYTKGAAIVSVTGSTERTNLAIYSPECTPLRLISSYLIALRIEDVAMGIVDAGGASFYGTGGEIGVIAPNLQYLKSVAVGNIAASVNARALLKFGMDPEITVDIGGGMGQPNKTAIITRGVSHLNFKGTTVNQGRYFDDVARADVTEKLLQ